MSKSLLLLASAALLLGCGDQPALTEPGAAARPAFRTVHSPDGPGAFAVHVPEASLIVAGFEPAPGLTALIGATYAEHVTFCETGEPPFRNDRLLVFRPDGSIKTGVRGAQLPLVVWQTAPEFTGDILADTCTEAFLALPHLEGTGNLSDRDNDLLLSGNRANSFSTRIVGQVASETGDRFKFLMRSRGLILRNGEFRSSFEISLNPLGN